MDFSKFKPADWLKVGGAAGFIIFGIFLNWAKFEMLGVSATGNNVFSYPVRGVISLLLVLLVGMVTLLGHQGKSVGKVQWPIVNVLASAVATLLMILLAVMGPDESGIELKPAIGLYLSLIATIASLVGSVMAFQAGGGNLNDLKDINRLKDSFGQGGGSTPPPPPPPPAV